MSKRVFSLFFLLIITVAIITQIFTLHGQGSYYNHNVTDYANVLSDSTVKYVYNKNDKLHRKFSSYDPEITIVSIESLDGINIEEYAIQLMDDLGVGDSKRSGGMLLLFSTTENEAHLAVGNRINRYFTEDIANEYMDKYFRKDYEKGNYDRAVKKLTKKLTKWYKQNYNDIVNPDMIEHKDNILLYILFACFFVGIGVYLKVQDTKRRDVYSPSYLKDLYNGTLNGTGNSSTSHHRHHHRSSSYSTRSHSSSSSYRGGRSSHSSRGRGGGGRGSGGGGGRR